MKFVNVNTFSAILLLWGGLLIPQADAAESCAKLDYVDQRGAIELPADFRDQFAHLGSWYVPEGDASGFHDVYMDLKSVKAYRQSGAFPDGAVMVKELRDAKTKHYTTGTNVARAVEDAKQWFVMIKDNCNRFAENPVWGDGWGWGLFTPDQGRVNVATNYKADCIGCHTPAKATDWVYIEAYPTLTQQK